MTVIRPNSISGITSITAQANEINVFRSNGTLAGLQINGVNFNTTSGISTLAALNITGNVSIAGTLTYQDVTNVDSLGIVTARAGVNVSGGQLDVGSNIKLGNAGVITATSFVGSGANLTGISGLSVANQADNRLITCTGSTDALNGEQYLTYSSQSSLNNTDGNGTSYLGGNYLNLKRSSGNTNYINAPLANADLRISADENLVFATVHTADFNSTERFRITAAGVFQSTGTTLMRQHSVGIGTTNTAGRNAGVGTIAGEMIYNTSTSSVQFYNGTSWGDVYTPPMAASGGSTSTSGGYKYHTFTSTGTFTVTTGGNVDALIVAGAGGGGGGGSAINGTGLHGGGGGAGGMLTITNTAVASGSYTVTVGAGGGTYQNGANSSFNGNTAIGGGKGSSEGAGQGPGNGGSGGGATYNSSVGSGTAGQGNNGGTGSGGGSFATGGGGGKGAVGGNAPNNTTGGNGGNGSAWLNGTTYAGGGGGCISVVGTPGGSGGSGGSGGGGAGAANGGTNGTTNTGGGGGGSDRPNNGGSGGSGIVIIRYAV